MSRKLTSIEILFPCDVEIPDGFEQVLDSLVGMACRAWEAENPGHVMWPAGHGSRPVWQEPNEPDFDDSVYQIQVAAREATEREIKRGRAKPAEESS